MSLSPCCEPGCPELTADARCATHEAARRKAQDDVRGSFRERGYDAEYDRNHAIVLLEETHCWICGQPVDKMLSGSSPNGRSVDHVVRRADGGGNERANLRLAHLRCNSGRRSTLASSTPPMPASASLPARRPFRHGSVMTR